MVGHPSVYKPQGNVCFEAFLKGRIVCALEQKIGSRLKQHGVLKNPLHFFMVAQPKDSDLKIVCCGRGIYIYIYLNTIPYYEMML